MTATLTTVKIEIPDETCLSILKSGSALEEYRQYLLAHYKITPSSITAYDLDNLRRGCIVMLGEKALKDMGLPVPAEKD